MIYQNKAEMEEHEYEYSEEVVETTVVETTQVSDNGNEVPAGLQRRFTMGSQVPQDPYGGNKYTMGNMQSEPSYNQPAGQANPWDGVQQ